MKIAYNLKPTKDCEGETFRELMDLLYLEMDSYSKYMDRCDEDYAMLLWKKAEKHLKSYIKNLIKQNK